MKMFSQDEDWGVKTLVQEKLGKFITRQSILYDCEPDLFKIMNRITPEPKTIVDMGTYKGCSALYLTQFAKHVYTFDILEMEEKHNLWKVFGVADKITSFVVKDSNETKQLLQDIDFDFAFIDGDHSYEGVSKDIRMLEKCGRLLFHDFSHEDQVVKTRKAVDELIERKGGHLVMVLGWFGYWEQGSKS